MQKFVDGIKPYRPSEQSSSLSLHLKPVQSSRHTTDMVKLLPKTLPKKLAPITDSNHKVPSSLARPTIAHLVPEQSTLTAVKSRRRHFSFGKINSSHWLITSMAMILFIAGMTVIIQGFLTNKAIETQSGGSTVSARSTGSSSEGTQDKPSETAPAASSIAQYAVAPDSPRLLIVPKLGIKSRVKALDVDNNNNLQAPTNIYDVGWYSSSAKPGESVGATLLDGHVSGPTNKGVFYGLKTLEAGDQMSIERGDGKIINYRVASKEAFPKDQVNMAKALVSVNSAKPGLNLITCTGKYVPSEKTFDQRLVIYAVAE